MTIVVVLGVLFLTFMVLGVPIAFALGIASISYLLINPAAPVEIISHRMTGSLFSFVLLALPAFLLSGRMMNSAGVTNRLFDFAIGLVGRFPGGIAHSNALASMLFASMSGTAVGDTGGLGQVEMKMMKKAGYSTDFAAGLTAASAVIGPIIPPSVVMVILGATAEISIGRLFLAGIIPGILCGVSIMGLVYWRAKFTEEGRNWPIIKVPAKEVWLSFIKAFFPLMTPVIILGGILLGVVTPTEAAVLAIDYAIVLGIVYRELTFKVFWETLEDVVEMTGVFMFIFAVAGFFSWLLTLGGLPQLIASVVTSITTSQIGLLIVISIIALAVGAFLDTTAAILLVTPIILPLVNQAGIDLIHFGVVFILALVIGIITPPFGICLFVMSDVANISVGRVTKAAAPYLIPLTITLLLVILFPILTTWIPSLFFN
ncbi:MAG: TRAP transporter large permease [Bacillota bacterium]|nr:TRAP transporter large permease [Bacillota bacterium]